MCRPTQVLLLSLGGSLLASCSDSMDGGAVAAVSGRTAPKGPGEGHDWPLFRGDAAQRGVASGELADELELLWTAETGGAIVSSPVVADGVVYIGSDDGHLHALELSTGDERWSFETEDIIEAPPMVHDGVVYVGSSDFNFYAVDAATGEQRWKAMTDDKILGGAAAVPAAEGDGTWIVVGSYDTNLYCFDAATGEEVWTYSTDNYVNGTPAVLDDRIVFGGCDAVLHVVSARTGEPLAQVPLGEDSHVAGSVALAAGRAYFGHYGNAFICVDLEGQELAWSYPHPRHPFFSSPAIGEDVVVFGGRDKHLHCVSREDGTPLWTFATRRKVDGSPVICGDKVVFGSGDDWLYVLRLADGVLLWSYEIGSALFSSPAVVDGMVIIGANDGNVYAFGPKLAEGDVR